MGEQPLTSGPHIQTSPIPCRLQDPFKHAETTRSYSSNLDSWDPQPSSRQCHSLSCQSASTHRPAGRPSWECHASRMAQRGPWQRCSWDLSPLRISQLHAMAACTAQALFAVGSSSAMCFQLSSPNLLQGPVQALTMCSPEPQLLQEKLSQLYSLGVKHQPKVTQTRKQFVLFWLHSLEKAAQSREIRITCGALTKHPPQQQWGAFTPGA